MNAKTIVEASNESGIGLPHSKTLARIPKRHHFRQVLECGSHMPVSPRVYWRAEIENARGQQFAI